MRTYDGGIRYESIRDGAPEPRLSVHYAVGSPLGPAAPGTLEHFLCERYLLFVDRRGTLLRGQVHHTPYPVQRAEVIDLHDDLVVAAGLPRPAHAPLVHWASGVDVEVFPFRPAL
jgi:uncharacterized protein YqjF (DUF2071 family)